MGPAARSTLASLPDYTVAEVGAPDASFRSHHNENALGAPPHVMDALRRLTNDEVSRYPEGRYAELLAAFARSVGVDSQCVAAGNGADEVLSALIDGYAGPGKNVVMMKPSFGWYSRFAKRSGASVREIAYRTRFEMNAYDVLSRCDERTGVAIFGNPNNPTGDLLPRAALFAMLERAPQTLVVVDETYVELSERSFAGTLGEYPNLAIVRSMSKVPALAGLRLGFLASTPEVAGAVRRWIQPYPLNAAAVVAGLAYINGGALSREFAGRYRHLVRSSLNAIAQACRPIARVVYPSAANFLLVDFGTDANRVGAALEARSIRVRRYDGNAGLDTCLRISALDESGTAAVVTALSSISEALLDA